MNMKVRGTSDMNGRVCIVTGANTGIGKAAALLLAKATATVVMACRSAERGGAALAEVNAQSGNPDVGLILVALASQESIRKFVADFKRQHSCLHVLINNAANFDQTLKRPALTAEGVETFFATNHLGPFFDDKPAAGYAEGGRAVADPQRGLQRPLDLPLAEDRVRQPERRAKVQHHPRLLPFQAGPGNVHLRPGPAAGRYTRHRQLHPGDQRALDWDRLSDLPGWMRAMYSLKRRFAITPEKMAETYLYLAASPEVQGVTGRYWDENNHQVRSSKNSYDESAWKRLWEVSE
jgi:hypothetical protein